MIDRKKVGTCNSLRAVSEYVTILNEALGNTNLNIDPYRIVRFEAVVVGEENYEIYLITEL